MSAIAILAEYRAKKIVKEQLRAKGIKVHTVSPRDIQILARNSS
jgi:N-dimethylarginine dimethylaminohydrolase